MPPNTADWSNLSRLYLVYISQQSARVAGSTYLMIVEMERERGRDRERYIRQVRGREAAQEEKANPPHTYMPIHTRAHIPGAEGIEASEHRQQERIYDACGKGMGGGREESRDTLSPVQSRFLPPQTHTESGPSRTRLTSSSSSPRCCCGKERSTLSPPGRSRRHPGTTSTTNCRGLLQEQCATVAVLVLLVWWC